MTAQTPAVVPPWARWHVRRGDGTPWASVAIRTATGEARAGVLTAAPWWWSVIVDGVYSVWPVDLVIPGTLEIEEGCTGILVVMPSGDEHRRTRGGAPVAQWERTVRHWVARAQVAGAWVEGL